MAFISANITSYSIKLASEANISTDYISVVYLHTTSGTAFLCFCPDDAELPSNGIRIQHGRPTYDVYYHHRYLPIVIDVLRNEKPIKFFFNDDTMYAGVRTGSEPVGEEEDQD
jgi:hypothetical protein